MKTRLVKLISNLAILVVALLVGGLIVEIILRVDGRYDDLTGENLIASVAIWDRPPGDRQSWQHPDLGYPVESLYNDISIRNHAGNDKADIENFGGDVVGFFGDSFTENRRVDDDFAFTSVLQKSLDPDQTLVLNFGIDGYGLDQSYLKYSSLAPGTLDRVFYVFFRNDFRNLYETQLFDFSDESRISLKPREVAWYIEPIRRLHLTYFSIESYERIAALAGGLDTAGGGIWQTVKNVTQRLFSGQSVRFEDDYADAMVRDLMTGDPSERTTQWAANFRRLLETWRGRVADDGGELIVIVLPHQNGTAIARALFATEFRGTVLFLASRIEGDFADYLFHNDAHWNEAGNLIAAEAIGRWGDGRYWRFDESRFASLETELQARITSLYAQ